MNRDFIVYMHVNKINNKRYVGITSHKDPEKRWNGGKGYFRNKHFSDAIERYGWENFDHIIVGSGLQKEEACRIEKELIRKYKTQDKQRGYNLTDGGEFFHHSEESKRLMSQNRKGKGRARKSPEAIERMKAHHAGGGTPQPVFCIETSSRFESINDAARATGINKKQISGCCRKVPHYNTAGGFHWRYANNED